MFGVSVICMSPGDPWLARIEDVRGGVLGAGTLLDCEHVLTCAHVVMLAADGAGGQVRVRLRGRSEEPYSATVVPECWMPEVEGQARGDVAVLRLSRPVDGAPEARLRRGWLYGEVVRSFGFPSSGGGLEVGWWAEAACVAYDMYDERVQLNPVSGPRIARGFSGAAALARNGEIVGMIVSAQFPDKDASWMVDVRALLRYAGGVLGARVTSRPPVDLQFNDPRSHPGLPREGVHMALERGLVGWLGSGGPGGAVAVCGGAAVSLIAQLVGLTVPRYRAAVSGGGVADVPSGAALPLMSIDVAVDATGKTAEQVAGVIASGLGLPFDSGGDLVEQLRLVGSQVIVVVNGVDAADDPGALYNRLLRPIAVEAPLLKICLLLGFEAASGPHPDGALKLSLESLAGRQDGGAADLGARIERLPVLAEEVGAVERRTIERYQYVAPRILGVRTLKPASAALLRVMAGTLLAAREDGRDPDWALAWVAEAERRAETARERAEELVAELDERLAKRDWLRVRLDASDGDALRHGVVEDEQLGALYDAASVVLYTGLCDLEEAERLVEAYENAVRKRRGGGRS